MRARAFALLLFSLFLTPLLCQNGEIEFKGRIDSVPAGAGAGTWQVDGRSVAVTAGTKLDDGDGPFVVGACVQVKGTAGQNGQVQAAEVKTEDSSECSGGQNGGGNGGGGNDDGTNDQGGGNNDDGPGDDGGNSGGGNSGSGGGGNDDGTNDQGGGNNDDGPGDDGGNSGSGNGGNDDGINDDELEFKGVLGSFPANAGPGSWVIGGRTVTVTSSTILIQDDGAFVTGGCVEVKAQVVGSATPEAVRIETESPEDCGLFSGTNQFNFKGLLQSFPTGLGPGVWQIGGRDVTVTAQTVLLTRRGSFVPGACVEAEGVVNGNSLQASKLQTENADDCGAQAQFRLQDRVRFRDRIVSTPAGGSLGNWQIGGHVVEAVAFTRLRTDDGPLEAGACADVKAIANGMALQAEEIRRERDEKCDGDDNRGELKFFGTVSSLPAGDSLLGSWMVDDTTVTVTASTRIEQHRGPVSVGSCVEVEGNANGDSSISAREIEVKSSSAGCMNGDVTPREVEFRGLIQELPQGGVQGSWLVAGRSVLVTAATEVRLSGAAAVGQCVKVHGTLDEDAVVVAREVETEAGASCGVGVAGAEFEVTGRLDVLPNGGVGQWTIGGIPVNVLAGTERNARSGPFTEGACVKAQGSVLGDGMRQAREVETRPSAECSAPAEFEFQGLVESAPAQGSSEWTISNIVVVVSGGTEIDERLGPLVVGACARVEGTPVAANRVNARQIHVLSGSGVCASSASTVGGATLSAGAVSPNQVVSIFGPGVGPASDRNLEINDDRVTRQLGANRVLFDGEAAPLLFLSSQQLNVITPRSLQGKRETEMQIETEGGWSQVIRLEVKPLAPGLFTLNASGRGQAAALNTANDGSLTINGGGNPIARGRVLVLYATGLGTANSGDDGLVVDPTGQNLPRPDATVTVTIGGVKARVLYAGGAPGLVFGVWQLNVEVPPNVQPGQVAVTIEVNGETSPEGVFVTVQ